MLLTSISEERSDKGSFFRQEVFLSKKVRIAACAFFVAGYSQYRSSNRQRAGSRIRACQSHVTEYGHSVLFFSQAQPGESKGCPRCPVPRFLAEKHLGLPFRCFSCAVRRTEQQLQISSLIPSGGIIGPKFDNLRCQSLRIGGTPG